MPTDNQALFELVRTTAQAVQDLSALVEAMPRQVDTKLAAMQEGFAESVRALSAQINDLQGDGASMRTAVTATMESFREQFSTEGQAVRQIIADNRAEIDRQFGLVTENIALYDGRLTDLASRVDTSTAMHQQVVEVLRGEVQAVVTALPGQLGEVRAACDTTDLHHGIAKVNEQLKSLSDNNSELWLSVSAAGARVAELAVERSNADETMRVQHETLTTRLQQVSDAVDTVASVNHKAVAELDTRVTETQLSFAHTVTELQNTNTQLTSRVDDTVKQVVDLHSRNVEIISRIEEVAGSAEKLIERNFGVSQTLLGQMDNVWARIGEDDGDASLFSRIANMDREHAIDLDATNKMLTSLQASVTGAEQLARQALSHVDEQAGAMARSAVDVSTRLDDLAFTGRNLSENIARIAGDVAAVQAGVAQTTIGLDERIGSQRVALDALTASVATLDERVATMPTREAVRALEDASQGVQRALADAHKELTTGIANARDEFGMDVANLATEHGALREQFEQAGIEFAGLAEQVQRVAASIPAAQQPFDPAPLREELVSELSAMVPKPEFPLFGFDVAAGEDDQSIVFTFSVGDDQVVRSVPFDIGFKYRGVYKPDEQYKRGNFVTHKGSMWYAEAQPTGDPGKEQTGWRLAVKRGADGKDAAPARVKHVRDPATGLIQESEISYGNSGDEPKE